MPSNLSFKNYSETGSFYTKIHEEIARKSSSEKPPTVLEFRNWLSTIKNPFDLSALDAGCGLHALNTREMLEIGFKQVKPIDINPDAIAVNSDVEAQFGSVLDIPFEDRCFDLVVCSGVIHHTANPEKAVYEIFRVLKSGGRAYISVYAFRRSLFHVIIFFLRSIARITPFSIVHRLFRLFPTINNFFLDHAYVPVLWLYRDSEFKSLLNQIGFVVESDFATSFDMFARIPFGQAISGDGLMRIYVCRKQVSDNFI